MIEAKELLSHEVVLSDYSATRNVSYNEISPIPLTPEILSKCGLMQINGDYILPISKDRCFGAGTPILFDDKGAFIELSGIEIRIPYVHTLQNLAHSLTGEELTIKM